MPYKYNPFFPPPTYPLIFGHFLGFGPFITMVTNGGPQPFHLSTFPSAPEDKRGVSSPHKPWPSLIRCSTWVGISPTAMPQGETHQFHQTWKNAHNTRRFSPRGALVDTVIDGHFPKAAELDVEARLPRLLGNFFRMEFLAFDQNLG